ncbi:MAG: hypothetical protein PHY29_11960 [Syntrophales bacterium]|nr:hypothetical protein [Syntrophales bacterium]
MRKSTSLSVLVSVGLVFLVSSCTCTRDVVQTPVVLEQSVVPDEAGPAEGNAPLAREHFVKSGECLWWIAEYEDTYNDPFMWPLIYNTNKDRIDNPDRIYPEQILRIPRSGYTLNDIREARRRAGAPPPYTPPAGSLLPLD